MYPRRDMSKFQKFDRQGVVHPVLPRLNTFVSARDVHNLSAKMILGLASVITPRQSERSHIARYIEALADAIYDARAKGIFKRLPRGHLGVDILLGLEARSDLEHAYQRYLRERSVAYAKRKLSNQKKAEKEGKGKKEKRKNKFAPKKKRTLVKVLNDQVKVSDLLKAVDEGQEIVSGNVDPQSWRKSDHVRKSLKKHKDLERKVDEVIKKMPANLKKKADVGETVRRTNAGHQVVVAKVEQKPLPADRVAPKLAEKFSNAGIPMDLEMEKKRGNTSKPFLARYARVAKMAKVLKPYRIQLGQDYSQALTSPSVSVLHALLEGNGVVFSKDQLSKALMKAGVEMNPGPTREQHEQYAAFLRESIEEEEWEEDWEDLDDGEFQEPDPSVLITSIWRVYEWRRGVLVAFTVVLLYYLRGLQIEVNKEEWLRTYNPYFVEDLNAFFQEGTGDVTVPSNPVILENADGVRISNTGPAGETGRLWRLFFTRNAIIFYEVTPESLIRRLLLTRSGDVEENPGPGLFSGQDCPAQNAFVKISRRKPYGKNGFFTRCPICYEYAMQNVASHSSCTMFYHRIMDSKGDYSVSRTTIPYVYEMDRGTLMVEEYSAKSGDRHRREFGLINGEKQEKASEVLEQPEVPPPVARAPAEPPLPPVVPKEKEEEKLRDILKGDHLPKKVARRMISTTGHVTLLENSVKVMPTTPKGEERVVSDRRVTRTDADVEIGIVRGFVQHSIPLWFHIGIWGYILMTVLLSYMYGRNVMPYPFLTQLAMPLLFTVVVAYKYWNVLHQVQLVWSPHHFSNIVLDMGMYRTTSVAETAATVYRRCASIPIDSSFSVLVRDGTIRAVCAYYDVKPDFRMDPSWLVSQAKGWTECTRKEFALAKLLSSV